MTAPRQTQLQIIDRLRTLIGKLLESRRVFEQVASTLRHKELQQSVIGLAQESAQYAGELGSQIRALGGETERLPGNGSLEVSHEPEDQKWEIREDEKATLASCAWKEASIVGAYTELLDEHIPYESLRKMIRYQLQGFLSTFSQLHLLSASL
jgi:hypothetical protein